MITVENKISIKEQDRFLKKCLKNELSLDEELKKSGLTYEHLRYRNYVNGFTRKGSSESFDSIKRYNDKIPSVSFFSGAGGLDLGLEAAGFESLAFIENNNLFCDTLRRNFPDKKVIGPPKFSGDIGRREEILEIIKSELGINKNFNGLFHGGPPCQPFSIASNQRFSKTDSNFKRKGFSNNEIGNLLFDFLWLINKIKPAVFIIENVQGLSELDSTNRIKSSLTNIKRSGYNVYGPVLLNASNYGVPQNRLRIFIVGALSSNLFEFPEAKIFQSACYDVFNKSIKNVDHHLTRKHNALSIYRYSNLDYGERDQLGRVDRLNPFLPSKTVIAGGNSGGGRSHLHPYTPRTLSVRESARLQTFPDDYIFEGSSARQFTQVGNAVPPLLAYKLGLALKKII